MSGVTTASSYQNTALSGISHPSSAARVYRPVTYKEGTSRVTEFRYDVPKGTASNLVGSFSYRIPSLKEGQLKAKIAAAERKLKDIQIKEAAGLGQQPKRKKALACSLRYLRNQLTHEVNRAPVVRVSVQESGDS